MDGEGAVPSPFGIVEELCKKGVDRDGLGSVFVELITTVRGWCSDDAGSEHKDVLCHMGQLFESVEKVKFVPAEMCGLAAVCSVLALKSLLKAENAEQAQPALYCLVSIFKKGTGGVLRSKTMPGNAPTASQGHPVTPTNKLVRCGAIQKAALGSISKFLSGSMTSFFTSQTTKWAAQDPASTASILRISGLLLDDPEPVLSALLAAIQTPMKRSRELLGSSLALAMGTTPSPSGLRQVQQVAYAWATVCFTEETSRELVQELSLSVEVLTAWILGRDESTSIALSMMAATLGLNKPEEASGPKREWQNVVEEALNHPNLAPLSLAPNPVRTAFPEGDRCLSQADIMNLVSKVFDVTIDLLSDASDNVHPINLNLLCVSAVVQVYGSTFATSQLQQLLQVISLAQNCGKSVTSTISQLLESLLSDLMLLPPLSETLPLITNSYLLKNGTLQKATPWPLLHLVSVIIAREDMSSNVEILLKSVWDGFCKALSTQDTQTFASAVMSFLSVVCEKLQDEMLEPFCDTLLDSIKEGISKGLSNFGVWGQAIRLLHIQVLSSTTPDYVKERRRKMLTHCTFQSDAPVAYPALLSPLRTSAVRLALAAVTGNKEAPVEEQLSIVPSDDYDNSTPHPIDEKLLTPKFKEVLALTLHYCRINCRPSVLGSFDRQGLFDLLQAAAHLLWGSTPCFVSTVDAATCTAPDLHCYLLRCMFDNMQLPDLDTILYILNRVTCCESFEWMSGIEDMHLVTLLLQKWLDKQESVTDEECAAITKAMTPVAEKLSSAHKWTVKDILCFLKPESETANLIVACVEGGHTVTSAVIRLLIQHNGNIEMDVDQSDVMDVVGGSPNSRKFAALATARTSVEQLLVSDWHPKLSAAVDKLSTNSPLPLKTFLKHAASRLVCKPCQSATLYMAANTAQVLFPILTRCLKPAPAVKNFSLLQSMLTIACTTPYSFLPLKSEMMSDAALNTAAMLLPPNLPAVRVVCSSWRLQKTKQALELIVGGPEPIPVLEGTLSDIAKWLLSAPMNTVNTVAELVAIVALGEGPKFSCLQYLVLSSDQSHKMLRSNLVPKCTTYTDIVKCCVKLLPQAGPTTLGNQLLLFAIAGLEYPAAVEAQRAVLRDILTNDTQKLQALVTGKANTEEPCNSDLGYTPSLCKRWLCSVIAGDAELKQRCRDCLMDGLPACLQSNGFAYLSACAEVCAGGDEVTLMSAVVKAFKHCMQIESSKEDATYASLLPVLEFIKAALSVVVRVDSKGWFSQPAAALAEVLSCLKFCHRALRSNTGSTRSSGLRSLAAAALEHKYESDFGCSFSRTKEEYIMMHWYLCYSTYPGERKGACSWCAEYCHKRRGYDVEYAGCIPAYCDTKGNPPLPAGCSQSPDVKGVLPHEASDPFVQALFHPAPYDTAEQVSLPSDFNLQLNDIAPFSELLDLLQSCVTACLPVTSSILQSSFDESGGPQGSTCVLSNSEWRTHVASRYLVMTENVTALEGTVDGRLEYDSMPHYEINLLQSRVLTRHVATASLCGWVALVDKSQSVLIVDESASFPVSTISPARRGDAKPELNVLARNTLRFKVIGMTVNPLNGMYLAAYGVHNVHVFVVSGGSVVSQIAPQLALSMLSGSTHVIHCGWLPGSHTHLAVVTTKFVKVFDLSADIYCPVNNYMLLEGEFAGAAFGQNSEGVTMFGITKAGQLYSQVVTEGDSVDGPFYLTNVVDVQAKSKGDSGCSIHYSIAQHILCVAYSNGKAFLARWDFSKASLEDIVNLPSSCPDRSLWSINRWEECIDAPGVFACILNDGANVGVISLDKNKLLAAVEVHDLYGSSGTHAEGIALVRHRPPANPSSSAPRTRPSSSSEALNLLVSLESGTVCSYPLDPSKLVSTQQTGLHSDELLNDIEKQKSAILTARPIPRTKSRRPGGKTSSRSDADRDREREKTEDDAEQHADSPYEALLLGRPLSRGAPFDAIPYNTLRAMSSFDAKWGGLNSRSDVPSTVALNVWEDLMPLGRTAWSITRGVGVAAEDKDKLADGSDLTTVTVIPPRALSRGPSVDGGGSPPLTGLNTPGISPCNSPPLSPLSQRSTSPPTMGLSPMTRPLGDRAPPPGMGLGIGDARPAARFVLQASGEAVICGVRLRLSCGKEILPGRSPGECSLLTTEEQLVVIRVASQTRSLPSDTNTRWLGFVLSHREAMKTTKQGVEVSIVTNGPEVVLKQIELFTCVSAANKTRADEGRASPDLQEKDVIDARERINRLQEPVSPLTSASSTLDAILQNLVSGRAGALSTLARKKAEEAKAQSQPSQRQPQQVTQPAPLPPKEEPLAKLAPVHTVLQTTLGCLRLALAASENASLNEETCVALWQSTLAAAKWGAKGLTAGTASTRSIAALHALFASARHKISTFRSQRATTLLRIACTTEIVDSNRMHVVLATAAATLDFRNEVAEVLSSNKDLLETFRKLIDSSLAIFSADGGRLPVGQESVLIALQFLSMLDMLASRRNKDAAGEAAATLRFSSSLTSPTPAARASALYVARQLLADKSLEVGVFSHLLKHLLTLKTRMDKISGSQTVPFYNCMLCLLSRLAYPMHGPPDLAAVEEAVTALLPQIVLNTSCDEFGVTPAQFLNIKTLAMLVGASFSPPSLQLQDHSASMSPEEEHRVDVMKLVVKGLDKKARASLKELVFALLNSKKLSDPESSLPTTSSDQLLPAMPPACEQARVSRDENTETVSASPPPAPCDLIARGAADFSLTNFVPLFSQSLSSHGSAMLNVYSRHTLVAALQLVASLHFVGQLEDINMWKSTIDQALRNDELKFLESDLKCLLVRLCNNSQLECQDYRDDMGLKKEHKALAGVVKNMMLLGSVDYVLSAHSSFEAITNIAIGQPKNWISFCKEEPSIVELLVTLLNHCLPPELAAHALRLLAFVAKPSAEVQNMRRVVNEKFLEFVIREYLLKSITESVLSVKCTISDPVADCKVEVVHLLRCIGIESSNCSQWADNAQLVADTLLGLLPGVASHGTKGAETLMKLAQESLSALKSDETTGRMAAILAAAVRKSCSAMLHHPRGPLYLSVERTLGTPKGCILEGGWAQDGSVPPVKLAEASLGTLGADIKYAPDTIFVRLGSAIQLKRVMMLVSDCKQSKVPKVVEVWHSSNYSPDARAVRDPSFQWHLLGRITVDTPSSICRAAVELPIVVTAHALKLHFAEFDCDPSAQLTETLSCPSCNQVITDRHGQCLNCEYENAYQCRQCRNINHEQLDAFLCNECGWCRYGRVDFSLLCRSSAAPDVLRNETDRVRALQVLSDNNHTAQQLAMQIADLRTNVSALTTQLDLNIPPASAPTSSPRQTRPTKDKHRDERKMQPTEEPDGVHPSAIALSSLYNNSAKEITMQLARCLRTQSELRRALFNHASVGNTTSAGDEDAQLSPSSKPGSPKGVVAVEILLPTHFGSLLQLCVLLLKTSKSFMSTPAVQQAFLGDNLVETLYIAAVQTLDPVKTAAKDLLVVLQEGNRLATDEVMHHIKQHVLCELNRTGPVSYNAAHLHSSMVLLSKCASCKDGLWFKRLPLLLQIFLKALGQARAYPCLLEAIAQAALTFAGTLLVSNHTQQDSGAIALNIKYGRKWLMHWLLAKNKELAELTRSPQWLTRLLFAPSVSSVAQQLRRTTESLAMSDSSLHAGILKTLLEHLPQAAKEGRTGGCSEISDDSTAEGSGTEAFFGLLSSLMTPMWVRILFTRRGVLPFLCKLILREAYHLSERETDLQKAAGGDGCVPVELGWSANKLVELLAVFITTSKDGQVGLFSKILKKGNGVEMLLDASLTLKSIAAVRTKQISSAETLIKGVLDTLVTESNADKSSFITASVAYLAKPRLTCQMGKHILEKVLNIVDPKPPEEICQLLFKKKPSQEDFIRGHMGNLPVASNTVGKTMTDVANKICRELDLQLDPDFGLELLVDSKIIDLKLPIQLVYDQVWKESSSSSSSKMNAGGTLPMLVVYRLQGLDGEATEERVDRLEEPELLQDEPSVKYAITECLSQNDALKTLVCYVSCVCDLLKQKSEMTLEWELFISTLSLLHNCCQVKANRVALAEQRSLHVMLAAVDVCGNRSGETAHTALQLLLSIAGSIAGEMDSDNVSVDSGADQHLEFCLSHLEQHFNTCSAQLLGVISYQRIERGGLAKAEHHLYDVLRLISAVVSGNKRAVERIDTYFTPFVNAAVENGDSTAVFYTQCLAVIIRALGLDTSGEIRRKLHKAGVVSKMLQVVKKDKEASTATPAVLRLLEALVKATGDPQDFYTCILAVVTKLHSLEKKGRKQEISSAAAAVLDALRECGRDNGQVDKVRRQTKQTKHDAAMALREKVLRDLNKQAHAEIDLDDVGDEDGLVCLICREVATFRPQDVLGFYMFARRVEIFTNTCPNDPHCTFMSLNPPARTTTYTCVTHFNAVHYACHKDAAQIDAAMRPAKREWEGATVRNLKTRCNAILPLKVGDTNPSQYHRCTVGFADRVGFTRGRGQLSLFEQSVYDMRMMLSRECWEHSYSSDSKGGGPEHNFSVVPFQMQLSLHYLDGEANEHERSKAASLLAHFISGAATPFLFHADSPAATNVSAEFIFYLLTLSLHVMSLRQWQENKYFLVRNLVAYLLSTFVSKQKRSKPLNLVFGDMVPPALLSSSNPPQSLLAGLADRSRMDEYDDDGDEEWTSVRELANVNVDGGKIHDVSAEDGLLQFLKPSLVFLCVLDAVHTALKSPDAKTPDARAEPTTASRTAEWVTALNSRLLTQQDGLISGLLDVRRSISQDFQQCSSLQEFLDLLEILPQVLCEAPSAEQWATQFLA
eukprot:TRINITY_DN1199_c0_g4_i1.p1 TRINITY_DN1199_c0_g4~~TRINITY_DN1199_c0_g4_i1.p1  ORF type:complete len:4801 (+),score=867.84 TRINITY_DN1199_c0_g4_i1:172-14574(+)